MKWFFENEELGEAEISGRVWPIDLSFDDGEILMKCFIFENGPLAQKPKRKWPKPRYMVMDIECINTIEELLKSRSINHEQNG